MAQTAIIHGAKSYYRWRKQLLFIAQTAVIHGANSYYARRNQYMAKTATIQAYTVIYKAKKISILRGANCLNPWTNQQLKLSMAQTAIEHVHVFVCAV